MQRFFGVFSNNNGTERNEKRLRKLNSIYGFVMISSRCFLSPKNIVELEPTLINEVECSHTIIYSSLLQNLLINNF